MSEIVYDGALMVLRSFIPYKGGYAMYQEKIDKLFFISHATQDEAIARQLKADLEEKGFLAWLAQSDIRNGQRWDQEIERGIKQSTALLYLVSPASRTSPYVHDELMLALDYQCPIKLVWIGGGVWSQSVKIGFGLYHYIDMHQNCYQRNFSLLVQDLMEIPKKAEIVYDIHNDNSIDVNSFQEINGWIKKETEQEDICAPKVGSVPLPSLEETSPDESTILPRPPYKSLYPFKYEDADIFFGRERVIEEMVWQIKNILEEAKQHYQPSRCMLVIGASGSGKSSAVMAGLLPYLQKDQGRNIAQVKRWLFLEPVQPGEQPLDALEQSLTAPLLNTDAGASSPFENWSSAELRKKLEEPDARGLHELLHKIANRPGEQIVLVIDQFEELFAPTTTTDFAQRQHFFNLLVATANEQDSKAIIIVTMRADFYDYILKQPELYQVVRNHKLEIPPMERDELRNIIIKPAQIAHVEVEVELVGDLLSDMRKQPDALPLLQFTLSELYYHREGQRMTRQKYEKLQGLGGAIDQHAEKIYRGLTSAERECTRELFTEYFVYLRELIDDVSRPGSSEELTRRRATRTELIGDPEKMDLRIHTAELFVHERLLTAQRTSGGETTYEISHEVLINSWKRLRGWISPNRESLYFLQRFRAQARRWQQEEAEKKKSELLYQGNDLKRLIESYKQQKIVAGVERDFFLASQRQQQWQQLRRRGTYGLSMTSTVIAVFALFLFTGFFAWIRPIPPDPTVVTTINETGPGSLLSVIANVPSNTTITFAKGLHGTILLREQDMVFSKKNLTIYGPTSSAISISSGKYGRNIHIFPQSDIILENLNLVNSQTQGTGFLFNEGILTLRNCHVQGNTSDYNGGGLTNYGTLNLFNTAVIKNTSSGNGGGIANQQGVINVENSEISFNHAYHNGGGIFSLGGTITLHHSQMHDNQADQSYGGGVNVLNGMLIIDDNSAIHDNKASYFGGGLGIQGSVAIVTDTSIYKNQSGQKGGGIMVDVNTDSGLSSLVTIKNINVRGDPNARYFIGQNIVQGLQNHDTDNIGGKLIGTGDMIQITATNTSGITGNPPPQKSPILLPNYLGVANITDFCSKNHYSYGGLLPQNSSDTAINVTCFSLDSERFQAFSARQVCQETFPQFHNVIDRFANYFDLTSLQCYRDVRPLGSIATPQFIDTFCKVHEHKVGLYDNATYRKTAYDWKCNQAIGLPIGFSVADACVYKYKVSIAIDRLTNYYRADGWECWAPI